MKYLCLFLIALLFQQVEAAPNNTSDYYKCYSRIGGVWSFGRAPKACKASTFMNESRIYKDYMPYVYRDERSSSLEQKRYMNEIYSFVNKAAEYYLKKVKPSVSSTELKWWKLTVQTLAHQETYFTHYRLGTDGVMRMMRGDVGHGHGISQVDDRWHFPAVKDGRAADLIKNLFYSLMSFI